MRIEIETKHLHQNPLVPANGDDVVLFIPQTNLPCLFVLTENTNMSMETMLDMRLILKGKALFRLYCDFIQLDQFLSYKFY
jgi:hypothetical protein